MNIWIVEDQAGCAQRVMSSLQKMPCLADGDIRLLSTEQVITDIEQHRGGGLFAPHVLIDTRFGAEANGDACAAFHETLPGSLVIHFTDMEKMDIHLLRHLKSASPHCLLSLVSNWRKDLRTIVAQLIQRETQAIKHWVVSTPSNAGLR